MMPLRIKGAVLTTVLILTTSGFVTHAGVNSRSLAALVVTNPAGTVNERVGISVLGLFHPRSFTVDAETPMVLTAAGQVMGLEPGQRVVMRVAGEKVLVERREMRFGGERVEVASRYGSEAEFTLAVPGKIRRRYRGGLVVSVADFDPEKTQVNAEPTLAKEARMGHPRRVNLGHQEGTKLGQQDATNPGHQEETNLGHQFELVAVVSIELETAVASVNAAESAPGTPMEALKAQAVAIRSYLVAGGPRHKLADFCDTTHCQFLKSPPGKNSAAAHATEATRGLVLAWQGTPFAAMYSASCAGRTHSLAEIGYAQRDYPYFPVECEYCRRHPDRWSTTISEEDAAMLAKKSDADRLRLARKLGWSTVPSNDYSAKEHGGLVDLSGVGRGHGLGLCERGGAVMAREGKGFREILEHYYPNTELKAIVPSESKIAISH